MLIRDFISWIRQGVYNWDKKTWTSHKKMRFFETFSLFSWLSLSSSLWQTVTSLLFIVDPDHSDHLSERRGHHDEAQPSTFPSQPKNDVKRRWTWLNHPSSRAAISRFHRRSDCFVAPSTSPCSTWSHSTPSWLDRGQSTPSSVFSNSRQLELFLCESRRRRPLLATCHLRLTLPIMG